MKNIAKRTLNILPIWAVIALIDWISELINEQRSNDGLYFSLGLFIITLVLNYVLYGVLTVWHKIEKEQLNES